MDYCLIFSSCDQIIFYSILAFIKREYSWYQLQTESGLSLDKLHLPCLKTH